MVIYDKKGELGQNWVGRMGSSACGGRGAKCQAKNYDQTLTKLGKHFYFQFLMLYAHTHTKCKVNCFKHHYKLSQHFT